MSCRCASSSEFLEDPAGRSPKAAPQSADPPSVLRVFDFDPSPELDRRLSPLPDSEFCTRDQELVDPAGTATCLAIWNQEVFSSKKSQNVKCQLFWNDGMQNIKIFKVMFSFIQNVEFITLMRVL